MNKKRRILALTGFILFVLNFPNPLEVPACSTFKLQKGAELIYGHNLNANGMDVPGLIFINKRGTFKTGRTWSELINKDRLNPSALAWISRYGSVTFNTFGKDLPDGGMNEAGLYIWEMGLGNAEVVYPKNSALPKLNQMNWMQYVLDNFSTLDEVLPSAHEIEIDGWGWHYFVGDRLGRCASVEFINGKVVVHQGDALPVPGLFNMPYDREVEWSRYFKGFGGSYEPVLNDPCVPRFVKTAVMLRDYHSTQNAVEYGFAMLKNLTVNETPDWSVLIDARKGNVYFRTSPFPKIKRFSMNRFDFSNHGPALSLNMDIKNGGDVSGQFQPFTFERIRSLIASLALPEGFTGMGGLSREEFVSRLTDQPRAAALPDRQYFRGVWKSKAEAPTEKGEWELKLFAENDAVFGTISHAKGHADKTAIAHMQMIGDNLSFTFKSIRDKRIFATKAILAGAKMNMHLLTIEGDYDDVVLEKQN